MMGNVFAAGLPPLFESLIADIECTIEQASLLPGYALLALGLAVSAITLTSVMILV